MSVRSITSTVVASVVFAVCMIACPVVQADDPPPASDPPGSPAPAAERPKYKWLRFEEDWLFLRDAEPGDAPDFWDRIKYVPFSENGSIWASFGGQMRLRLESWQNFLFGSPPNDDDSFLLWRLLLHADVHLGQKARFFVQGKCRPTAICPAASASSTSTRSISSRCSSISRYRSATSR